MTNCIRNGIFEEREEHPCFVCDGFVIPAKAETCPICNWKKCQAGHCGCDLSQETRDALTTFSGLFCYSSFTPETRIALSRMIETWINNCIETYYPIKGKNKVIWIQNGVLINHKPKRTPKIGWTTLTILEALTDSARTAIDLNSPNTARISINKALKILRTKLAEEMKDHKDLIPTCEFRETQKTRCNRAPAAFDPVSGQVRCCIHIGTGNGKQTCL